jgi:hypothetical protein
MSERGTSERPVDAATFERRRSEEMPVIGRATKELVR